MSANKNTWSVFIGRFKLASWEKWLTCWNTNEPTPCGQLQHNHSDKTSTHTHTHTGIKSLNSWTFCHADVWMRRHRATAESWWQLCHALQNKGLVKFPDPKENISDCKETNYRQRSFNQNTSCHWPVSLNSALERLYSPHTLKHSLLHKFSSSEMCVCVSYFVNSHLFEGDLQELEVVDVFVLQLGTKFHFLQRQRVGKQHVHELTVGSACTNKKQTSAGSKRGAAKVKKSWWETPFFWADSGGQLISRRRREETIFNSHHLGCDFRHAQWSNWDWGS